MSKPSESSIVTKCALVMDVLSRARQPLVFSDIVAQTGFVKSSCHRILAVLQSETLIEYDKASRTYRTGPRLHDWARSAWRRIDLQQAASETMATLAENSGMNAALSVLDEDTILYLRTYDMQQVRHAARPGDHAPLHCTAAGKVFLAHLNSARLQTVRRGMRFEKFTENTKTTFDAVKVEFPAIRARGFATSIGEEFLHVTGVAAPIWNVQDQVTAGLSLWSRTETASPQQVLDQSDAIIAAAQNISERIGWAKGGGEQSG